MSSILVTTASNLSLRPIENGMKAVVDLQFGFHASAPLRLEDDLVGSSRRENAIVTTFGSTWYVTIANAADASRALKFMPTIMQSRIDVDTSRPTIIRLPVASTLSNAR